MIGRYILTEKAGNFRISKTVLPEDAKLITKYMISSTDSSGESRTFGPYVIYGNGSATGTLPPGRYTVTETIVSEDESYTWEHGSSTASLEITDGKDGNPTPVVFASSGTVKTGSLHITSSLDASDSGITFHNVSYTILDANGNRAKNTSGQEIADIYFNSHEAAAAGSTIENLKTGTYVVRENNVPAAPDGYSFSHIPADTDRMTVTVT